MITPTLCKCGHPGWERGDHGVICDECWAWLCEYLLQKDAMKHLVEVEMDFRDYSPVAPLYKQVTVEVVPVTGLQP